MNNGDCAMSVTNYVRGTIQGNTPSLARW